jgi:teichuronic acid exporter
MSLKKELVSGTIYMAVAKYSGLAMTILITAILSRLLTPENFGVVALAGVMLALFNLLADIGIGPAVIQNKTLTAEDMNSINTFNSYQGLVLGVAFFFSAPFIAEYYGNPQVKLVCQIMSVNILMGCVNAVPNNILYRQQRFKLITIISLCSQFIAGAIAISMAFHGCGPISLLNFTVKPRACSSFIFAGRSMPSNSDSIRYRQIAYLSLIPLWFAAISITRQTLPTRAGYVVRDTT